MGDAFHVTGTIVLNCRHVVSIMLPLPEKGAEQYCRSCGDWRIVERGAPVFVAKCATGRCTLNRNCKADKDKAFTVARNHVQKMSRHKVVIYDSGITIAEITNTDEALFATVEQIHATEGIHQTSLRKLAEGTTRAA